MDAYKLKRNQVTSVFLIIIKSKLFRDQIFTVKYNILN